MIIFSDIITIRMKGFYKDDYVGVSKLTNPFSFIPQLWFYYKDVPYRIDRDLAYSIIVDHKNFVI